MTRSSWLFLFVFIILGFFINTSNAQTVIKLDINGIIGPAIEDYVGRGIMYAEEKKASLIILQLNTPGGLETSTRGINSKILNSKVPVVTYVAPSGARATSAGTFILYASHIAAMAPGTHLGSATPVNIATNAPNTSSTISKKSLNNSIAYIKTLAELRQRNADWGEDAVVQAVSLSAKEALNLHVINMIAEDIPDLLKKLQGQTVNIKNMTTKIDIRNAEIVEIKPDWRVQFLSIITNPSIAYILLLVGIYALFFELMSPGLVIPGLFGIFSLLIGLYAFQLLPINYVGLSLILIGIASMIAEVFVTSFGALGIGGLIAFVTGSIFLFDSQIPGFSVAWPVLAFMTFLTLGFIAILVWLTASSIRAPIVSGREALIGMTGEVIESDIDHLLVRVNGEIWNAYSATAVKKGQKIRVVQVDDLKFRIEPIA